MQMMFFCLFTFTLFFTTRNMNLATNFSPDENIFYGDPSPNPNKLLEKSSLSSKTIKPNIKILSEYISQNKVELAKESDISVRFKGKCLNFHNLSDLFPKKKIKENLNNISEYLNDFNYIYKDENGNFLIYSICKNVFFFAQTNAPMENEAYIKCFQKFIFVSKIDFSFYSFTFNGEKLPILTNFSVDFVLDEFANKRVRNKYLTIKIFSFKIFSLEFISFWWY